MNNFDFNRYISFVDEISNDMNYPNSIRHLLYVVVPVSYTHLTLPTKLEV